MRKVKPCPFCNGQNSKFMAPHLTNDFSRQVRCPNCGASGPKYFISGNLNGEHFRLKAEAIAAWNRRPCREAPDAK